MPILVPVMLNKQLLNKEHHITNQPICYQHILIVYQRNDTFICVLTLQLIYKVHSGLLVSKQVGYLIFGQGPKKYSVLVSVGIIMLN